MPENRDDMLRDKNLGGGKQGDQGQGQNPDQRAPGRDPNDDRLTGRRQGMGREDQESELPDADQPKPNR